MRDRAIADAGCSINSDDVLHFKVKRNSTCQLGNHSDFSPRNRRFLCGQCGFAGSSRLSLSMHMTQVHRPRKLAVRTRSKCLEAKLYHRLRLSNSQQRQEMLEGLSQVQRLALERWILVHSEKDCQEMEHHPNVSWGNQGNILIWKSVMLTLLFRCCCNPLQSPVISDNMLLSALTCHQSAQSLVGVAARYHGAPQIAVAFDHCCGVFVLALRAACALPFVLSAAQENSGFKKRDEAAVWTCKLGNTKNVRRQPLCKGVRRRNRGYFVSTCCGGHFQLFARRAADIATAKRQHEILQGVRRAVEQTRARKSSALGQAFAETVQSRAEELRRVGFSFTIRVPAKYWIGRELRSPRYSLERLQVGLSALRRLQRARGAVYRGHANRYSIFAHNSPSEMESAWLHLRDEYLEVWAEAGWSREALLRRLQRLEAPRKSARLRAVAAA
eukprot:s1884_g8.t1